MEFLAADGKHSCEYKEKLDKLMNKKENVVSKETKDAKVFRPRRQEKEGRDIGRSE